MAWLEENELRKFKRVGRGVKISTGAIIYGANNIEVGDNVRIDTETVILASQGSLKIGSHVHVAARCLLAARGGIKIGDFAGLSFDVKVISASDDASGEYLVGPQFPDFFRKVVAEETVIREYAFIGAGATVLVGANVDQGAMLGANSVALPGETLKSWTIYFGVPAHRIRERKQDLIEKSLEMHDWWQNNPDL